MTVSRFIRMSHWRHTVVDGAEFWIISQWLRLLRKASHWQLIQNSAPSTIMWRQCDIRINLLTVIALPCSEGTVLGTLMMLRNIFCFGKSYGNNCKNYQKRIWHGFLEGFLFWILFQVCVYFFSSLFAINAVLLMLVSFMHRQ